MLSKNRKNLVALFAPVLLLCLSCGNSGEKQPATPSGSIVGKKIAIVVGQRYFRDVEFTVPKTRFEAEGALVFVVSSALTVAEGDEGTEVKPDIPIDDLKVSDFDAVVFIGGSAVKRDFWDNPDAHAVCRQAVEKGKILAAICWGPVVLANAGVLRGKKATGHDAQNAHEILKSRGCIYTGQSVTVDGNIITAFGPTSADSFATAIVDALK
jgi:protease I